MSRDEIQVQGFSKDDLIIYKLGKIENALTNITLGLGEAEAHREKMDKRLKIVEGRITWAAGAVSAISFITTSVINFFWHSMRWSA